MSDQPPQHPSVKITPQPLPTSINMGLAQGEEDVKIILIFTTPLGPAHYFLDAEGAQHIGNQLINLAGQAKRPQLVALKKQLLIPGQ